MSIQFEYFYGNEAEQFTFYRIPKILVTSPTFKRVSDSAKLLYGLMLDRKEEEVETALRELPLTVKKEEGTYKYRLDGSSSYLPTLLSFLYKL